MPSQPARSRRLTYSVTFAICVLAIIVYPSIGSKGTWLGVAGGEQPTAEALAGASAEASRAALTSWVETIVRQATPENELAASRWLPAKRYSTYEEMMSLNTYEYDFARLEAVEASLSGYDRASALRQLFQRITRGQHSDCDKWYATMDFLRLAMRHTTIGQPMHRDGSMVCDPLTLLSLGEGRCGHMARVVVDLALANGYQARLVQLACHLVAEVRWGGRWHSIDVDADFPPAQVRTVLRGLPSVEELANDPYLLDRLPACGWRFGSALCRTEHGQRLVEPNWYPGTLLTSSMYFGAEILQNRFSGDVSVPRKGLIYCCKTGTPQQWQRDRDYGWGACTSETAEIRAVPVEYATNPLMVLAPSIVYRKNGVSRIAVRFLPASRTIGGKENVFDCTADTSGFDYEVRVSTQSRGWDDNFRNYEYMPRSNDGKVAVLHAVRRYEGGMLGVDLESKETGDLFIEVLARQKALAQRKTFTWPSNEACVHVVPESRPAWNCRRMALAD